MLLDSPSKHSRVERHLMRQRGTGARTITASFSFSFGPPSVTGAPPEKSSGSTATQSGSGHASTANAINVYETQGSRTNSRGHQSEVVGSRVEEPREKRSYDAFVEEAIVASPIDDESIIERKQPKTRPRKRKRIEKERPSEEMLTSFSPTQPAARSRPRRGAATNATARVVEGFAEEATPIDLKRQGQESSAKSKTARRGRPRKIIASCDTNRPNSADRRREEVPPSGLSTNVKAALPRLTQAEQGDFASGESTSTKQSLKRKRKAASATKNQVTKSDYEGQDLPSARQPLAEASVNNIIYASSPEKQSKDPGHQVSGLHSTLVSQTRTKSGATPTAAITRARRPRKRLHVIQDEDSETLSNLSVPDDAPSIKFQNNMETSNIIKPGAKDTSGPEPSQSRQDIERTQKKSYGGKKLSQILEKNEKSSTQYARTQTPDDRKPRQRSENNAGTHGESASPKGHVQPSKPTSETCETADSRGFAQAERGRSKRKGGNVLSSRTLDQDSERTPGQDGYEKLDAPLSRHYNEDTVLCARTKKTHAKRSNANFSGVVHSHKVAPVTRPEARVALGKMPKMNLDDLLSNIASLAQNHPSSGTAVAGRLQRTTSK